LCDVLDAHGAKLTHPYFLLDGPDFNLVEARRVGHLRLEDNSLRPVKFFLEHIDDGEVRTCSNDGLLLQVSRILSLPFTLIARLSLGWIYSPHLAELKDAGVDHFPEPGLSVNE